MGKRPFRDAQYGSEQIYSTPMYCIDVHGQNEINYTVYDTVREIGTEIYVNSFIFWIRKI